MKQYFLLKVRLEGFGARKGGFSLLETLLVLGVATGLMLLAFVLNKGRQETVVVEDAKRQVLMVVKSLNSVKNTLTSYTPMISSAGLTQVQAQKILPKELFDSEGMLSSAFGPIDIRAMSSVSASDSYAISYSDVSENFCTQLASKVYDQFYQVRVGSGINMDPAEAVWTVGEEFNPDLVAKKCSELSGARVVQFISEPLRGYNGSLVTASTVQPISPIIASNEVKVIQGSAPTDQVVNSSGPGVSGGGVLDLGSGYTQVEVDGGGGGTPGGGGAQCNGQSFSWNPGCSGTVAGAVNSGSMIIVNNTAAGLMGGLRVSCNNGAWSQVDSTCNPIGCAGQHVTWGGGCSAQLSNAVSGSSQSPTSASSYTGSAVYTCNSGSWSIGASSCNPPAATCGPSAPICKNYVLGAGCIEFEAAPVIDCPPPVVPPPTIVPCMSESEWYYIGVHSTSSNGVDSLGSWVRSCTSSQYGCSVTLSSGLVMTYMDYRNESCTVVR